MEALTDNSRIWTALHQNELVDKAAVMSMLYFQNKKKNPKFGKPGQL